MASVTWKMQRNTALFGFEKGIIIVYLRNGQILREISSELN